MKGSAGRLKGVLETLLTVLFVLVGRLGPLIERSSGWSSSERPSNEGGGIGAVKGEVIELMELYPELPLGVEIVRGDVREHGVADVAAQGRNAEGLS